MEAEEAEVRLFGIKIRLTLWSIWTTEYIFEWIVIETFFTLFFFTFFVNFAGFTFWWWTWNKRYNIWVYVML